jgi:large subunit ribosomal protein L18
MIQRISSNQARQFRHTRIRETLKGTSVRPRLSVFRSNQAIYVQLIDDVKGVTLAHSNTTLLKVKATKEGAEKLGTDIAEKALALGLKAIVFDRSGYLYHGRVQVLADAARKAGLVF